MREKMEFGVCLPYSAPEIMYLANNSKPHIIKTNGLAPAHYHKITNSLRIKSKGSEQERERERGNKIRAKTNQRKNEQKKYI